VVAEPARQQRVSVWKFLLLSACVKTQSCWTVHNDQPLVSHALPLAAPPSRTSRSRRLITMALSSLVKPAAIAGLCNPSGVSTSRAGMTTGPVLGRPVAHPTWPMAQRADLSPPIGIWGTSGNGRIRVTAARGPARSFYRTTADAPSRCSVGGLCLEAVFLRLGCSSCSRSMAVL